ncbi:hypothetical protein MGA5115_03460 [Marinomonas gallaica]|uniref:Uncharacterized protein n=1 Tax=Marinomonas gallaica TaxID=1806667 RepID=A0A1C3JVS5_9GAMM|nr:DUF6447 family protein [Marinomonas gallaica]SBT19298.1 hypothetical protein MGA5115_03460 [Marinomonas gallaica]SBT22693.1 hypothetical protein MGA5116_03317 [Marinomonas gallaica]
MATLTFDEQTYQVENLSDDARARYNAVQFADKKLRDLKELTAILQTASRTYAAAVQAQLPDPAHPNKKKGVISIDGKKYVLDDFETETKQQLFALQQTDRRLEDIKLEIALVDTARNAYIQSLQQHLSPKH